MNSLSGIRAINNGNRPVAADRYQVQYRGNSWAVFDSWTNGWGSQDSDHAIVSGRVDDLNEQQRKTNREKAQAKADAEDREWVSSRQRERADATKLLSDLDRANVLAAQDHNESLRKA
ncbi:hypothetical protein VAC51_00020 [Variovorax phage VAC_51]|uniref:Uncharacterized protein n=1 Tax=Variovorax phage VAC_51 TaxID=2985242 RepID=A0A9N6WSU4_9CAUD|nr:hypothetical protein VAC51_00020 [Variovorax phage VAC_51]